MTRSLLSLLLILSFTAAGCSVHPLPKDVTREETAKIVEKIWCEARRAIDELTVAFLRNSKWPQDQDWADRIERPLLDTSRNFGHGYYVRDIFPRRTHTLSLNSRRFFQFYSLTAIGFDYRFFVTENNDATGSLSFFNPTTIIGAPANFTLALSGSSKKQRSNDRRFVLVSTFHEMHRAVALDPDSCASRFGRVGRSLLYPITGEIGIKEVIRTYGQLQSFGLVDRDRGGKIIQSSRFTDQLIFTTTLDASVTPSISISPIAGQGLRLASASGTLGGKRNDLHQVTISIESGEIVETEAEAERILTKRRGDNRNAVLEEINRRRIEDVIITVP